MSNKYLRSLDKINFDTNDDNDTTNNKCTCKTQPTCDWCDDTEAGYDDDE